MCCGCVLWLCVVVVVLGSVFVVFVYLYLFRHVLKVTEGVGVLCLVEA